MSRLAHTVTSRRLVAPRCFNSSSIVRRALHSVAVQLDYYMSAQFAGMAVALQDNLYSEAGLDVTFLPICDAGLEMNRVSDYYHSTSIPTIGVVEQNIFVPLLHRDPSLDMAAVGAMFRQSPLCLASLIGNNARSSSQQQQKRVIGAHEDTVDLFERLLADAVVVASPRATKNTLLSDDTLHAIQAYTTTEVATLEHQFGADQVKVEMLEGMNGARLGYSQVLFCPRAVLERSGESIEAFLAATFEGWQRAIRDPSSAAAAVEAARAQLGLEDESNDHWVDSNAYLIESVRRCGNLVADTFQGDRHGVIDGRRWAEASAWLLGPDAADVNVDTFGLDQKTWKPASNLLSGSELGRVTLSEAKVSASEFQRQFYRKPSLVVITVGEHPRYQDSARRIQLYSNTSHSWFSKAAVGRANGFAVEEIVLPASTTTDELLSIVYAHTETDGIQLMWPLPDHVDSASVYKAIPVSQDVDGAHYIGQVELAPGKVTALPPVTPSSVMHLLDEYKIDLADKHVVVVGRSRIVGSPIARMLRDKASAVTIVHSETLPDILESLVGAADLVVSCVGIQGILKAEWIKPGADVVVVGTAFDNVKDMLVSDIDGDLSCIAGRYTPVPGGVGPLSMAFLLKNTVEAAFQRASTTRLVEKNWTKKTSALYRTIRFSDYTSALAFANQVDSLSTDLDHHANMTFSHKCVNGVDLMMELFTFEANSVTDKDYLAAQAIDYLYKSQQDVSNEIRMSDFTYNLKLEAVAQYPAHPRGSSRLLRVDESGNVSYHDNFADSFMDLAKDVHIVFNESKVANARVSVVGKGVDTPIEMMILDIGDLIANKAAGLRLNVMLRKEDVQVGDVYASEHNSAVKFRVVEFVAPWIEDEHSNGNGSEAIVECITEDNLLLAEVLNAVGTVPIPPYLNRSAEESDKNAYNNVFAASSGSVAAPTAGLHFTKELLDKIGPENLSFLSLHVGAGTFKPVVVENAHDHKMHGESFHVNVGEMRRIIQSLESNKRLVVVGTTSSRTLESLYWCGVKLLRDKEVLLALGQREWMELMDFAQDVSAAEALKVLIEGKADEDTLDGRTHLMIVPGKYEFKVVNELVTNFHAPDSTLMLLVAAFLESGEKVKTIYEAAQEKGYRFLSYGDVCFFSRPRK